jgi:hypothetical protein
MATERLTFPSTEDAIEYIESFRWEVGAPAAKTRTFQTKSTLEIDPESVVLQKTLIATNASTGASDAPQRL